MRNLYKKLQRTLKNKLLGKQNRRQVFLIDTRAQKMSRTKTSKRLRNRGLNFLDRFTILQQVLNFFRASVFITLGLIFMAGFIVFAVFSPYFDLKKITVTRDNPVFDVTKIETHLEEFYGQNLLFIDKKEMKTTLLETFPEFRKINIKELWPSEIVLEIEIAQPYMTLENTETANFSVMSEDGIILQQAPDPTLPVLRVLQHPEALSVRSEFLTPVEVERIVEIQQRYFAATDLPIYDTELLWAAKEIHLLTVNDAKIWLDLSQEIEPQILKLINAESEIGLEKNFIEHVDLRIPSKIYWK